MPLAAKTRQPTPKPKSIFHKVLSISATTFFALALSGLPKLSTTPANAQQNDRVTPGNWPLSRHGEILQQFSF